MSVQYKTNVLWDKTLCSLEFIEDDAITRAAKISGLCNFAIKITTGAPAATANKFAPSAQIQNVVDGTWYENTGSTASPVWSLVPASGSGITQLTGDVTAGPGNGSKVATVAGLQGKSLTITSPTAGDMLYYNGTAWVNIPIGTAGQVLTVNAGATAPEWA